VLNWLWENAQKCTPQVNEEGDEEDEQNRPKNKPVSVLNNMFLSSCVVNIRLGISKSLTNKPH